MGQGYMLVNKKKREFVKPHGLGNGYKFLEFFESATASALTYLLVKGAEGAGGDPVAGPMCGHWAGDVVLVIGEYDASGLYHVANEKFKDITPQVAKDLRANGVDVGEDFARRSNPVGHWWK